MRLAKTGLCVALTAVIAFGATGCGTDPLLAAASGAMKIANSQMSQLTAAEVQAMSELVIGVINEQMGVNQQPLTADQAAAIVAFLQANNVNSPDDLAALIEQAQTDPSVIQGLDGLAQAFIGTDSEFNPNNVNPGTLNDIFAAAFGG